MEKDTIKVIMCRPKETAQIVEIPHTLEKMQELVDGCIQAIYPFADPVAIIVNDEGKLIGLPLNRGLRTEDGQLYDIVAGTMFICGLGEEDFTSVSDQLLEKYYDMFKEPEQFIRIGGQIMAIKTDEQQQKKDLTGKHHIRR